MAERICIFCGRRTDTERYALFRLPADLGLAPDTVHKSFLEVRGITGVRSDMPALCSERSPECSKVMWENGRQVLVTRTGRNTDTMVCPSCHSEFFRNTDSASVSSAVFFGRKGSGKTSLILSLAGECITKQFSPDDRYRYIFNDRLYDPREVTAAAERVGGDTVPDDLRRPVSVYRVPGAKDGGSVLCDVMYDVSESDISDELAFCTSMPFAFAAGHLVYCITAERLAAAAASESEAEDIAVRRDIFGMMCAFRYSETPPVLDIAVTKLDTAEKAGGTCADILRCAEDEAALGELVRRALPSVAELGVQFSGVRFHAVSAVGSYNADEKGGTALKLYSQLFG